MSHISGKTHGILEINGRERPVCSGISTLCSCFSSPPAESLLEFSQWSTNVWAFPPPLNSFLHGTTQNVCVYCSVENNLVSHKFFKFSLFTGYLWAKCKTQATISPTFCFVNPFLKPWIKWFWLCSLGK